MDAARAQRAAHHRGPSDYPARHGEDHRLSGGPGRRHRAVDVAGRRCRHHRTDRRRAADRRPLDPGGGFYPERRDGIRLFPRAFPERISSLGQRWHVGRALLFHLSVSGDRGPRSVERRCCDEEGLKGATMDQFNRMLARFEPMVLSIFRIMVGLLLFQYAVAKLFKFPAVSAFASVTPTSLFGVAGIIELIFGALLIVGLWTRPAAFILCGEMAFAYFMGHLFKAG